MSKVLYFLCSLRLNFSFFRHPALPVGSFRADWPLEYEKFDNRSSGSLDVLHASQSYAPSKEPQDTAPSSLRPCTGLDDPKTLSTRTGQPPKE